MGAPKRIDKTDGHRDEESGVRWRESWGSMMAIRGIARPQQNRYSSHSHYSIILRLSVNCFENYNQLSARVFPFKQLTHLLDVCLNVYTTPNPGNSLFYRENTYIYINTRGYIGRDDDGRRRRQRRRRRRRQRRRRQQRLRELCVSACARVRARTLEVL